ncbi:hypothetical protein [Anaeromyxobacter oryzae]|nr:hypothetical protein [Anaeromyxobacter oryzae]
MLLGTGLTLLVGSSCGSDSCDAPAGCVRAGKSAGACQCLEWQTVAVNTAPIKFVVVSITYGAIGNGSVLSYGWTGPESSLPAAASELGGRLRAVVREDGAAEHTAAMVNTELGELGMGPLHPVTPESAAVLLAWGDGQGSGSAWGFRNELDVPGLSADAITVWVNPTLTVATDFAGGRQASWSWTSVGHCFWPNELSCEGPHFLDIPVEVLDGTRSSGDTHVAEFIATLTPAERTAILSYHPLYDPPGRDPATLKSDPRFLPLGTASVDDAGSSVPVTTWLPCQGDLSDADVEVLHETEIPFLGSQRLFLQHSVLSRLPTCQPQQPGIALATSTPGCAVAADVYVDRAFGTLLLVATEVASSCTRR